MAFLSSDAILIYLGVTGFNPDETIIHSTEETKLCRLEKNVVDFIAARTWLVKMHKIY